MGKCSVGHLTRTVVTGVAVLLVGGSATRLAAETPSAVPNEPDGQTIIHVLNRLGFGPTRSDVERVRQKGLARYIDEQLHPGQITESEALETHLRSFETLRLSPEMIAQQYLRPLPQLRQRLYRQPVDQPAEADDASADDSFDGHDELDAHLSPGQREAIDEATRRRALVGAELIRQKILRATYGRKQLQEVLVDFWFNHFNVFYGGNMAAYVTAYERDVIRPHVLGRFRDLLGAVAHSPAILVYLDNWRSVGPHAPRAARSTSRNVSAPVPGLNENYARELMELHTLGVDGGYTQQDVIEVAKCFTGWTVRGPSRGGEAFFNPRMHEPGMKEVLGRRIDPAGERDGEAVLDLLAEHPSTARFIATKLARRFVADDPPQPLIDRAAARFRETDGDLREVVRTIITSPEFFDTEAHQAKMKSPFEFVVSALRATEARIEDSDVFTATLRRLGMPLYHAAPPTGYVDHARSWIGSGVLLARINFALALANNRLRGVTVSLDSLLGQDPAVARHRLLLTPALRDEPSRPTRQTASAGETMAQVTALTLGSPDFQRR